VIYLVFGSRDRGSVYEESCVEYGSSGWLSPLEHLEQGPELKICYSFIEVFAELVLDKVADKYSMSILID